MRDYLTDGRISLRKYRLGDEVAMYAAIQESLPELTRWGFFRPDFSMQDAVEDVISRISDWDEGKIYNFLIEETPGGLYLGNCAIEELELESNHASVGWWVRTSQTRRGIATAAGRLVAQAAFECLPINSLAIYTRAENTASRRVAEKIRATLVRIKPEDNGVFCAVYELKPESVGVTVGQLSFTKDGLF